MTLAEAQGDDEIGEAARAFNSLMASWQQMVYSVNTFMGQLVSLVKEADTSNRQTLDNMQEQHNKTRSIAASLQSLQGNVDQVAENVLLASESTERAKVAATGSVDLVSQTRDAVTALSSELAGATRVEAPTPRHSDAEELF